MFNNWRNNRDNISTYYMSRKNMKLIKRTPDEQAKYYIDKYLKGEITLYYFRMLINQIELPYLYSTLTGRESELRIK